MLEQLKLISILIVFLCMVYTMFKKLLPALIALPLLAFLIAIIGGVTFRDFINIVVPEGVLSLSEPIGVLLFGGMFSVLLQKTKVAESLIKLAAELSGENPIWISMLMFCVITLLFSVLSGLGAVIMVASIVIPILASVGLGSLTITGIFLLGISTGGILNVSNWAIYTSVLGVGHKEVKVLALLIFALAYVISLFYIIIQLKKDGFKLNLFKTISYVLLILVAIGGVCYISLNPTIMVAGGLNEELAMVGSGLKKVFSVFLIMMVLLGVFNALTSESFIKNNKLTFIAPFIPIILILFYDVSYVSAFVIGMIYTLITTYKKGSLNVFIKSLIEGASVVMPTIILMFGLGVLLVAIVGPQNSEVPATYAQGWPILILIEPIISKIIPQTGLEYVIVFTVLSPLALYRGPLNIWGLGYGIAAVFMAAGMSGGAVMGLLLTTGQVQGISDPTNLQNIWIANEIKVDVQKILWNTLPYSWILSCLGLIIASLIYY